MHPKDDYRGGLGQQNGQGIVHNNTAEVLNCLNKEIEALTCLTAEVKGLAENAVKGRPEKSSLENRREPGKGEAAKTIDLVGFVFRMLERFWLIALAAIIGTAGAWYTTRNNVPVYSATAKMYIVSPGDSLINFSDLQLGTVLTLDYQELFQTWEVHELVRKDLNLNYSYQQLQSMISISNPEDTRVLYVTAVHPDPQLAADIANAYTRAAKVFITENMRAEEPTDFSIALVPSVPISTSRRSTIIKGFLLGSVLAVGLLFVQYVLDDRPQTPEDITTFGGIPTLAILPSVKAGKKGKKRKEKSVPSRQESRL